MNVFALGPGRCGSVTFIEACGHATNFTAGHETNNRVMGSERWSYPPSHIEADPRMAWLLGSLEVCWGRNARYVRLKRDPEEVATSYAVKAARGSGGATMIYGQYMAPVDVAIPIIDVCRDMVANMEANITAFLRDKQWLTVRLDHAEEDFTAFWKWVRAEGDLGAALAEYSVRHNAG